MKIEKIIAITGLILIFSFLIHSILQEQTKTAEINLLAAREGYTSGLIADLSLEIKPGTGKIFIDTFPLTKLDTQFSFRFAKEFACQYTSSNCKNYDFFYKITSPSTIIGGPSAGAAATTITIALLENKKLDQKTAITGTINSGGIIGPVGGVKAKIEAAATNGIKKVLIPRGNRFIENNSQDLVEYGKQLGIKVIEISTITDVLNEFGLKTEKKKTKFYVNDKYLELMKKITNNLCNRTELLKQKTGSIEKNNQTQNAINKKLYYTAASYCFIDNINLQQKYLLSKNYSNTSVKRIKNNLQKEIEKIEKSLKNISINNINDLQTLMIVDDRLRDSKRQLKEVKNNSEESITVLGFALERFVTAQNWINFFNFDNSKNNYDDQRLKQACSLKLTEASERIQYVSLYFPIINEDELNVAQEYSEKNDYALCIFHASKAKAEADAIISTLGVKEDQLKNTVLIKRAIAQETIANQINKGAFPILGYSYYEYSGSVFENAPTNALLYAEYALELSDLELYFKEDEKNKTIPIELKILLQGLLFGIFSTLILLKNKNES